METKLKSVFITLGFKTIASLSDRGVFEIDTEQLGINVDLFQIYSFLLQIQKNDKPLND